MFHKCPYLKSNFQINVNRLLKLLTILIVHYHREIDLCC